MSEQIHTQCTGSTRELEKLTALFKAVWPRGKPIDADYLRWLYCENPRGRVIGLNAWSGGEIVGHYAVIPIRAVRNGISVTAGLSLNTAVHPSQQGRGLFTTLANETYAIAKEYGMDHIVGVANTNSTPGFIRKLGFQLIGSLKARFVTAFPVNAGQRAHESLDWEREWSADEYSWRLMNPAADYHWTSAHHGLVWCSRSRVLGIRVIMEQCVPDAYRDIVITKAQRGARAPLRLWIGLEPTGLDGLEPRGYELPQVFRRSPLNLIFKPLGAQGAGVIAPRVRFSLADFDAF